MSKGLRILTKVKPRKNRNRFGPTDQLFRTLDDVNPVPELAELVAQVMEEANRIGVGSVGFGGKASLIGCKVAAVWC